MQKFGNNGSRLYCCTRTRKCVGKKCKKVKSACKFQGPVHTRKFSLKCTTVHFNKACGNGFKRERCCGFIRSCVGTNCKTSRGQCSFAGKEKRVIARPIKKIVKKVIRKTRKYTVKKTKKTRRPSCKRIKNAAKKCACIRADLKRSFKKFNSLKTKAKFLPAKVVRKFKTIRKLQKQRKTLHKNRKLFTKKAPKKVQKNCVREAKRIQKKLQKIAPFLKKKKSLVRRIRKAKITHKRRSKKVIKKIVKKVKKIVHKRRGKKVIKKIVKKIKKVVKPKIAPIKRVTCEVYADPHVRDFNGTMFEAQTDGEWDLLKTKSAHFAYRGKRFGTWVGVVDWIAVVAGVTVRNVGFTGVSVNGKTVALLAGKPFALRNGATVTQTGTKFNINSGKGDDVDFVAYGYFFNAYVRSASKKVAGLCNHEFIRSKLFGHPTKHVKKAPKIHCANKSKHLKTCKAKNLKGGLLKNCIFDLCARFPKDLERKILKDNKKETKKPQIKKPVVMPVKRVTCDLYADPHARSFDGVAFEAQTVGQWLLHKGDRFAVYYLGKSMGSWVGVVEWIVKVRGDVIRSKGFNGVTVNGRTVNLTPGKALALRGGGSLTQVGNKYNINSNDGEDCDFISFGTFFNAYVRSNKKKVSGLCSHQFINCHAFGKGHKGVLLPKPKLHCKKKAKHLAYCKKKGLSGRAATNCAFDLCAKLPKDIEKKMLKENKKEGKHKTYTVSPVKRVTCDLYADPHARSFDGTYFEAQTEGEWLLHKGQTLQVDYRGKKMGTWVGVVDYIINVKGDIIRNTGFSGVTVNGRAAKLPEGKKFALPHGGSILHAGNKVTVSSESGEEVDFISFPTFFNAYVRSNLAHVSGLCSHEFVKSTAFGHTHTRRILHPKLNCRQKAKHMKYCKGKGLKGIQRLNCAFDLCAKLPKEFEKRILKRNHKERLKKLKKIVMRGPFFRKKKNRHVAPLILKRLIKKRLIKAHRKFGGFGGRVRRVVRKMKRVHRKMIKRIHRKVKRVHRARVRRQIKRVHRAPVRRQAPRRRAPVFHARRQAPRQAPRRVHRKAGRR